MLAVVLVRFRFLFGIRHSSDGAGIAVIHRLIPEGPDVVAHGKPLPALFLGVVVEAEVEEGFTGEDEGRDGHANDGAGSGGDDGRLFAAQGIDDHAEDLLGFDGLAGFCRGEKAAAG